MEPQALESTPANSRLHLLRALWLGTFAVLALLLLVGMFVYYRQMLVAPSAPDDSAFDPALPAILAEAGIPAGIYALYKLLKDGLLANFPIVLLALLIFWRRGHDRTALLMSYLLLLTGGGSPVGNAASTQLGSAGVWLDRMISLASANALMLIFFLFPTGSFAPRWTKWLALAFFVLTLPNLLAPGSRLDFMNIGPAAYILIALPLLGSFIYAQVYRYHRVSGPIERLQTRWAMIGLIALPVAWGISGMIILLAPALAEVTAATLKPQIALDLFILQPLYLLFPIGMGIAILRYRLYDIDVIIRKTLVYGVLTALLALVYFGGVVLLQRLVGALTGVEQSPLAVAVSTLVIVALFTPLRRRIQEGIDRRFYRKKYDAQQVLARFAVTARDETDLDALAGELTRVVQDTLQPEGVTVWLRPSGPGKSEAQEAQP